VINLTRALKYPFSGPDAVTKMLIGSVLALLMPAFLPIVWLLGYQRRIIRDVIDDRDESLPEWNDFGGDFLSGITIFLGTLLYYLPAFVLVGLGVRLGLDAAQIVLPDGFGRSLSVHLDRAALSMVLVCFALALIWLILSAPLVMTAVARYAETGEFSSFVHILDRADEAWEQRKAAGALMLNLFVLTLMTQLASAVGSATICLVSAYIQFINFAAVSHLNGQWGAVLKNNRRKPSVIRPIKPLR
jgi:hypothetical protein